MKQVRYKFNDCFQLYMIEIESTCKPNTIVRNKSRISYFIKFYETYYGCDISNIYINDVQREDLVRYQLFLRGRLVNDNHPYKPTLKSGLKDSTIHDYIVTLVSFFKFCIKNEYLDSDPIKNFKIMKSSKSEKLPLYEAEVERIESCFNMKTESGVRNMALIHVGLDAGLRSSEMINLRLKDVNFDSNYIFIENSKWARSRYIPLSFGLKKLLLIYRMSFRLGPSDPDAAFFCQVGSGDPLTNNSLKMFFQRLRVKADVPRLHAHLLRHTFASSFILGGGDVLMLANLLGHSDIKTSQGYVRMSVKYKSISDDIYRLDSSFIDKFYYKRGYRYDGS